MEPETRHAVITGGTGSLGSAIAAALQAPGWTIAAPGSKDLDVRDPAAVRNYFHHRDIDLLVCAAGITRDAPIARLTHEAWDDTWSVNFRGALDCANAVLPGMIARGSGHIIFISSHSALHPPAGQAAYGTAKAALFGTGHRSRPPPWSVQHPRQCRAARFSRNPHDQHRHRMHAARKFSPRTRLGRFNTCERVAAFIRFLHHDLPHTSGQVFQLDSR